MKRNYIKLIGLLVSAFMMVFVLNGVAFASSNEVLKTQETDAKQAVEQFERMYKNDLEEINNTKKLEAEDKKIVAQFKKYIDEKMHKDGLNSAKFNDRVLRQKYNEKYVSEFVEHAIKTGLISDIDISSSDIDFNSVESKSGLLTKYELRAQWYAASLLMSAAGLEYTGFFMRNSLRDNPSDLVYSSNSEISGIIKNSRVYKDKMDAFKENVSGSYYKDSSDRALTKQNSTVDMYLALHKVKYLFEATRINVKEWEVFALITDRYNFEYWNYEGNVPDQVVVYINNCAALAQELGAIVPYDINIYIDDYI